DADPRRGIDADGVHMTVACRVRAVPSCGTASVEVSNAVYPAPLATNFTRGSAWPRLASKTSAGDACRSGGGAADRIVRGAAPTGLPARPSVRLAMTAPLVVRIVERMT